jgi:hypothetical protein
VPGFRSRWSRASIELAPNQVFIRCRLYVKGELSAMGAGEEVVPASEYRALQHQVHELQRGSAKRPWKTYAPLRCQRCEGLALWRYAGTGKEQRHNGRSRYRLLGSQGDFLGGDYRRHQHLRQSGT